MLRNKDKPYEFRDTQHAQEVRTVNEQLAEADAHRHAEQRVRDKIQLEQQKQKP